MSTIGAQRYQSSSSTRREACGFGMTIEQALQQILNRFIVPVSSFLLITVVGTGAEGAGFITNQFHTLDIKRKRIT
jgi:hypothetical protein